MNRDPMTPDPSVLSDRGSTVADQITAADIAELRAIRTTVNTWSASAFLAGERVHDPEQHKADLYGFMCKLANHLLWWADAVEALIAHTPQPSEAARNASEGGE